MSESTKYAPGELALLAFAEAWAAYCKQHGLAWPAPKIAVEDGTAIARFHEQRISVRPCDEMIATSFAWCSTEADARWLPVVWYEVPARELCEQLASVLDRRIPW